MPWFVYTSACPFGVRVCCNFLIIAFVRIFFAIAKSDIPFLLFFHGFISDAFAPPNRIKKNFRMRGKFLKLQQCKLNAFPHYFQFDFLMIPHRMIGENARPNNPIASGTSPIHVHATATAIAMTTATTTSNNPINISSRTGGSFTIKENLWFSFFQLPYPTIHSLVLSMPAIHIHPLQLFIVFHFSNFKIADHVPFLWLYVIFMWIISDMSNI